MVSSYDDMIAKKHVIARSPATRQSVLLPKRSLLHYDDVENARNEIPGTSIGQPMLFKVHTSSRLERSGTEGSIRQQIITIATAEHGIKEATGNNDGKRVEEYLRYTHLGKGHAWCAAFVSWCYGQAGLPGPRNPWSPALFPDARTYWKQGKLANPRICESAPADIFGIYGVAAKRINHVGLVKAVQSKYLITIEGNSNNRVESKRRHLSTIYALADWISR